METLLIIWVILGMILSYQADKFLAKRKIDLPDLIVFLVCMGALPLVLIVVAIVKWQQIKRKV